MRGAKPRYTRRFELSLTGQVGTDDVIVGVLNPSEVRTEFDTEYHGRSSEERFGSDEVTSPRDIADAIAFTARQDAPNAVADFLDTSFGKVGGDRFHYPWV